MSELALCSFSQRQRLAFIDFCLAFFGQLSRFDIIERFQTGVASATRDLTLYKQLAAGNLILRHQTKLYYRTAEFTPLFSHNADNALLQLSQGEADSFRLPLPPSQFCLDAIRLIQAPADIVATLMLAITQKRAVRCTYVSLSSGESQRELVPHAVANSGHRWHVRCYDRRHNSFRDFVCNRFLQTAVIDDKVQPEETSASDQNWNNILRLKITPHPAIEHKKAIELDYAMENGVLELESREALFGYLAQQWHIDCSKSHSLNHRQFPLALANPQIVDKLANPSLLPGAE